LNATFFLPNLRLKLLLIIMTEKAYTVLVAEDENFQRLALMDILSMCEYETVAVENGRLAME
jgi:hypothetical protein